jgi:hypothetical protein
MELQFDRERAEPLVTDHVTALARTIRGHVQANERPGTGDELQLFRIYAVLALAKGVAVGPEDVHDAWCAWMAERDPEHAALLPFRELNADQQALDEPLVRAIRAAIRP